MQVQLANCYWSTKLKLPWPSTLSYSNSVIRWMQSVKLVTFAATSASDNAKGQAGLHQNSLVISYLVHITWFTAGQPLWTHIEAISHTQSSVTTPSIAQLPIWTHENSQLFNRTNTWCSWTHTREGGRHQLKKTDNSAKLVLISKLMGLCFSLSAKRDSETN